MPGPAREEYMPRSKCFCSGIGERQIKEVTGHLLLEVWLSGRHFPSLCVGLTDRAVSPPRVPSCPAPSLPSFLFLLYSLFFLFISEVSTWEKLDSFYFIVIIHISRNEISQMKIYTVAVKTKAVVFDIPWGQLMSEFLIFCAVLIKTYWCQKKKIAWQLHTGNKLRVSMLETLLGAATVSAFPFEFCSLVPHSDLCLQYFLFSHSK